jgi:hypothetical protein
MYFEEHIPVSPRSDQMTVPLLTHIQPKTRA